MRVALAVVVLLATAATAAGQPTAAPPSPTWFNLPLMGGSRTLAALGIAPDERHVTMTLLARALHGQELRPAFDRERLARLLHPAQPDTPPAIGSVTRAEPVDIPVPLTPDVWRWLLDIRPATGERSIAGESRGAQDDLSVRLLTDRSGLLVASGLTSTDETIRALLLRDRETLRTIFRHAPGALAVAARSLRIEAGRVVTPGGPGSEVIWEKLAGESVSKPAAFIIALLTRDGGRLAWYFDSMSRLEPERAAATWRTADGRRATPTDDAAARLDQARLLYEGFRDIEARWQLEAHPFRRVAGDPWMVLALVDLTGGALAGPAWQWLWTALFDHTTLDREDIDRPRDSSARVSLAWLAREIARVPPQERRDRFEMFRLAQRVFRDAPEADAVDIAVALGGYRRYRALLLTMERMEIPGVTTWAAVVEAARRVDGSGGNRRATLASFQAAVACVDRIRHVRTIDALTAARLLRSLSDAVVRDRPVAPAVAAWVTRSLVPALPPLRTPDTWTGATAYESTILQALAGPKEAAPRSIAWEGLTYSLDFSAAELERLHDVRRLLPSPGLDAAVARGDPSALAEALTVIVYAVALGDPDGPATLGGDVPARHDFGASTAAAEELWSWALPFEQTSDGGPWRAQGALLGLDLGFARLATRRVADQEMPNAPTLTLNDFASFARTVVAIVPSELDDQGRDELVAALGRGRRRVADADLRLEGLLVLAREVRLSSSARELLPWIVAHQPDAVGHLFSMRDLLWLGKPLLTGDRLDRWGVSGQGLDGRLGTAMPQSGPWEDFGGRADRGQMATQVPDLTLRLAEETARLGLPAQLVPALLAFAVDDYWHDVRARFSDDWLAMTRQAAALTPARVEDYVAALAGRGPLRIVRNQ